MTGRPAPDAFQYLFGLELVGIKFGLANIRTVLDAVIQQAAGLHTAGTFGPAALAALARHAGERQVTHSVETGSGASTEDFVYCCLNTSNCGGCYPSAQPMWCPDFSCCFCEAEFVQCKAYRYPPC